MCRQWGHLAKQNYLDIKKRLEVAGQRVAQHKVGGRIERRNGRNGYEGDGKEVAKVQRGKARGATHRKRRRGNESAGQPNGRVRIYGDQGDKNGGHQETYPDIRHQPLRFHGTQLQLVKGELVCKPRLMATGQRNYAL